MKQNGTTFSYPPLAEVSKPTISTAAAAFYLNREARTLWSWSSLDNGPVKPIRINGRLAWPVADIKQLLGIS